MTIDTLTPDGGLPVAEINVNGSHYMLILAPNGDGDCEDVAWNESLKQVNGALSYCDGAANTAAMLAAGSELAKWARGLRLGGFDDWYLPSLDELELCYRYLKPTTNDNYCYGRAGINVSALPPRYPYTPDDPQQTVNKPYRKGGAEAFAAAWYWSSTQSAATPDYAWLQYFYGGNQHLYPKSSHYRARAVRR